MAGGITDIGKFAAGTSLDLGSSLTSSVGGFAAFSNPLSAGLSVLSALGGLGGGTKISASQAQSQSGLGVFAAENTVKKNKPMIDFSQPFQVVLLAAAGVLAMYMIKKVV